MCNGTVVVSLKRKINDLKISIGFQRPEIISSRERYTWC